MAAAGGPAPEGLGRVALLAPPYFGHLAPMVALGEQLLGCGWRVSLYADPEFGQHVPAGVEHVPVALPHDRTGSPGSAVERFRDDWRQASLEECDESSMAADFVRQFAMVTRERPDGSCKLEEYHLFVAGCMDRMKHARPDCVVADFCCFVPGDACWLQVFCEKHHIALLRLNSQAQPDILVGKNLFTILHMAVAKGLFARMAGSDSLLKMPRVMAKSSKMMRDRGYGNDPIAGWPFTVLEAGNRLPHTVFPTVPSLFFDRWEEGRPAKVEGWMSLVGPLVRGAAGCAGLRAAAPELADWLETSEQPCVYVAFGTLVIMTPDLVSRLSAALWPEEHLRAPASARWRVLWSLRREYWGLVPQAPRRSGLLRLEHFVPQVEVLQSKQVPLMVSHHGQNSTTECLVAGKPMVGLPFFSDQHHWARIVQRAGASVHLSKGAPAERIRRAVEDVLACPRYTEAAQALSDELRSGRPAAVQVSELLQAFMAREAARTKQTSSVSCRPARVERAVGLERLNVAVGVLLALGGALAFARKHSVPSLLGGVGSGTALLASAALAEREPRRGFSLAALVSAALAALMLQRALRTRKVMPAGMLSLLGCATFLCNASALQCRTAA